MKINFKKVLEEHRIDFLGQVVWFNKIWNLGLELSNDNDINVFAKKHFKQKFLRKLKENITEGCQHVVTDPLE